MKRVNASLSHLEILEESLMLKLICLIVQKKLDSKNAKGVDTSKLAAKSDLASLKDEIDKIDVDKLKTVPVDLSKLSSVVNNQVVKKTVFDILVAKSR